MNINITKRNKIDKVSYPLDLQINFKKINIIKESKVFCCI